MLNKKAQSSMEYVILISIIAASLFGMEMYFKRGLQGKIKASADEISGGFGYAPGRTNSSIVITKSEKEDSETKTSGDWFDFMFLSNPVSNSTTNATSNQTTQRWEKTLPY